MRRVITLAALLVVGLIAGLYAIAFVMQGTMIFPRQATRAGVSSTPAGVEQVWIDAGDGVRVEGWYLRGEGRSADSPGTAVMFFHGNAELIDFNDRRMAPYVDAGIGVLLVEYRGYGRSGGTPTQRGIVADAVRFREWLDARTEVDPDRVVYHGRSLGGGVAAQLAARRAPAAMVLESTFTSVPDVAGVPLAGLIVRHPFRTAGVIGDLACPILFVHGTEDRIIPKEHSERLAGLARDGRVVMLAGGHNDFPRDEAVFWERVLAFVSEGARENREAGS